MPPGPRCTVCTHRDRATIDREIVAGTPIRRIAITYSLVETSLRRHRASHLRRTVAAAVRAANVADAQAGTGTLDQIRAMTGRMLDLLEVAEGDRDEQGRLRKLPGLHADGKVALAADVKAAATAMREIRGFLGLQAELLGEVTKGTTVNVLVDAKGKPRPEWLELKRVLKEALRPYPDAARAVALAFAAASALPVLEEAS